MGAIYRMVQNVAARGVEVGTALLDEVAILRMLILRGLKTKYVKNPLGLMLEFLQPIVICTVHYFYFILDRRLVPGNQYLVFVVGGFTVWFCFIRAFRVISHGPTRQGGVTNIPGVTQIHLCLASAIWAFLTFFLFANAIAYPCMLLGIDLNPPNFLVTTMTYAMAAGLGFGFGLVIWAVGEVVPALGPFLKLSKWALYITSGIYASIATMSPAIAPIIWYNPLIHLAEYQRNAFYPGYPTYLVTLTYPAWWTVGLVFSGLLLHRWLANRQSFGTAIA